MRMIDNCSKCLHLFKPLPLGMNAKDSGDTVCTSVERDKEQNYDKHINNPESFGCWFYKEKQ